MTKRDTYLRKKYEITEEEFQHLLGLSLGKCWICGRVPKTGSLNVDHDHKIQKEKGVRASIRGLLCGFPCNKKFIGRYRREHARLYRNAAHYLTGLADMTQDYLQGRDHVASQTEKPSKRKARKAKHKRRTSVQ